MTSRAFFDTNILIYEFDARVPRKQQLARQLVRESFEAGTAVISYQVVQEFLNTMTKKFSAPLTATDLRRYLASKLWPMCEVHPSPGLFAMGLAVRENSGFSFYDSLIVSAAIQADCDVLYSEDLQNGQRFKGLEIRNPFA